MVVNSTFNHQFQSDAAEAERLGKEEFDQLVMGYNVRGDNAPVESSTSVPAKGSVPDAVVTSFLSNFKLTGRHRSWNMFVEGERYTPIASARPKGCDAGKAKYYEKYTIYAYKGKGSNMKLIGMMRAELLYTDEATGFETGPGIEYLPITNAIGRFEAFKEGNLKIQYNEDGTREMTATAAMPKTDRLEHDHALRPLRNLDTGKFARDRV